MKSLALVGFIFGLMFILEKRAGMSMDRYRSKNFFNDVMYTLFYRGGVFNVLLAAVAGDAWGEKLVFLRLDLLDGLPVPIRFVLWLLIWDFFSYWIHRMEHEVPFLWAFHSVHHSQERLTVLTTYRIHPVEAVYESMFYLVPFLLIGLNPALWPVFYVVFETLALAKHSEISWGFGRFYKFIVSPAFHSVHHSAESRHLNSNFGAVLSVWDFLFGTGVKKGLRPDRFGVDGLEMPETLAGQTGTPFSLVYKTNRFRTDFFRRKQQ